MYFISQVLYWVTEVTPLQLCWPISDEKSKPPRRFVRTAATATIDHAS